MQASTFEADEQVKAFLMKQIVNDARITVHRLRQLVPRHLTREDARLSANLAIENAQRLLEMYSTQQVRIIQHDRGLEDRGLEDRELAALVQQVYSIGDSGMLRCLARVLNAECRQ